MALAGSLATPTGAAVLAGTVGLLATAALSSAVAVGALRADRLAWPGHRDRARLQSGRARRCWWGSRSWATLRKGIPTVALARIAHTSADVAHDAPIAIAVVAAWIAAAFAAGAWRTKTRET